MKKPPAFLLVLCLALSLGGCAVADVSPTPDITNNGGADTTPTTAPEANPPANTAAERITFITQLYEGDNIVEIPYIEYDGENPELDSLNRIFNQGYQARYEEFLQEKLENEWIEIKTYPFTTDKYIQLVVTKLIAPTYGTEGELESFNYDRIAQKVLNIPDALAMLGMTEEEVKAAVTADYAPQADGETLSDVKISGFRIHQNGADESVQLLLTLTVGDQYGSSWDGFYSYWPAGDGLTKTGDPSLFDPQEPDTMDPPLWYQKSGE